MTLKTKYKFPDAIERVLIGFNLREPVSKNDNHSLEELKKLTATLGDISLRKQGSVIEMDVKGGTNTIYGLYKNKNLAVCRAYISKGATSPFHVHKNITEWVIVYAGEMVFQVGKEAKILRVGNYIEILPDVRHRVKMVKKDVWCLCVTIPADPNFPEGIT